VEALPSPAALAGAFAGTAPVLQVLRWLRMQLSTHTLPPADAVLVCPGNQFFSMGRFGWPLILGLTLPRLALQKGIPLYTLPQSLGPFTRAWERRAVRQVYREARAVWLRDALSLKQTQAWGVTRSTLACDPALALESAAPPEARAALQAWGRDSQRPAVGVSFIPAMVKTLSQAQLTATGLALAEALGALTHQVDGLQIFFFPQVSGPSPHEDDRPACQAVLAALPEDCDAHLVETPCSPALLKACYGQMDLMVAGRLHAGLFAAGMSTATLWLGYLTKTRGMLTTLELEDALLELPEVTPASLSTHLLALWARRVEAGAAARQAVSAQRTRLDTPFETIAAEVGRD
jgi:colanic acid/amylovoran biosynthesis protein